MKNKLLDNYWKIWGMILCVSGVIAFILEFHVLSITLLILSVICGLFSRVYDRKG